MEPCLNFGLEQQAIGRISRIGQQQDVTVVRLIASDTIEEHLVEAASRKRRVVCGDEEDVSLRGTDIAGMFQLGSSAQ